MRLYAYKLLLDGWSAKINLTEQLYNQLKKTPKMKDSNKWEYTIVNVSKSDNFIYGVLGQQADEFLFEYDDSKIKIEFDKYRWYETFFVVDISNANLFVHKYNYKPNNLTHKITMSRIEEILANALYTQFNQVLKILPYREGINSAEFKEIFYKYTVHETKFTRIKGNYIPEGTKLHNPNKPLDEIRRRSHNQYDANILNSALLEAIEGRNLSKSPTARSLLESGSTGDKITYTNENGERVTEYKETNAYLNVNDPSIDYNPDELFIRFKKKMVGKVDDIKKYKLFEKLDSLFKDN